MAGKNKKRSSNFTKEEETLLISLVNEYKETLECKKSGHITWKKKQETWIILQKAFNARSNSEYRDLGTIKQKYQNLKKITKQKCAQNRRMLNQTGGGSFKMVDLSTVDISIKEILGDQVDGLPSMADSDFIELSPIDIIIEEEINGTSSSTEIAGTSSSPEIPGTSSSTEIPGTSSSTEIPVSETNQVNKRGWDTYCPAMLKEPLSKKLRLSENFLNVGAASTPTTSTKRQELNSTFEDTENEPPTNLKSNNHGGGRYQSKKLYESIDIILENNGKPLAFKRDLNKKLILEKMAFLKFQRELLQKEHALKMEILSEEHAAKMEILSLDLVLKRREAKDQ